MSSSCCGSNKTCSAGGGGCSSNTKTQRKQQEVVEETESTPLLLGQKTSPSNSSSSLLGSEVVKKYLACCRATTGGGTKALRRGSFDVDGARRVAITRDATFLCQCKDVNCCPPGKCFTDCQAITYIGTSGSGRTTFQVQGICCKGEIPKIEKVLQPIQGCKNVHVDVKTQTVTVDHNPMLATGDDIATALTKGGFAATIIKQNAASAVMSDMKQPADVKPTSTTIGRATTLSGGGCVGGRSKFRVDGICCASEIPQIQSILGVFDSIQKEHISINVTTKMVYVQHDTKYVTANDMAKQLTRQGFYTKIEHDYANQALKNIFTTGKVGESKFHVDDICDEELEEIQIILNKLDGIEDIQADIQSETLLVKHNADVITADDIEQKLTSTGFLTDVEYDFTSRMGQSKFHIDDLCENEMDEIKTILKKLNGTQDDVQVDIGSEMIMVHHDANKIMAEEISRKLTANGFLTDIEYDFTTEPMVPQDHTAIDTAADDNHSMLEEDTAYPRPTVMLAGFFWLLSMISYVGGTISWLQYAGLLSVACGAPPIASKAYKTLRRGNFDTNCLMLFAAIGAILLRDYHEAATVTFLFALSEWLEVRATSRGRAALASIVNLKPDKANVIHPRTKQLIIVPASSVPVGSMISIKSGDKIPCDGIVMEGTTTVNESSLTGESRPVVKTVQDTVSGGTVNSGNTQIIVRTTHTSEESAVSRLIRLVEEAQANRSETEQFVDAFARIYTPIVVVCALGMCTIPWALFGNEIGKEWMKRGLVLVVIACPCALIISTPVLYVAGLAATAQKGILIKGGAYLEALGVIQTICFDKTGTLTLGKYQLLQLQILENSPKQRSRQEILQYLSLMEERASHPLAQAIVDGIQKEGITVPPSLEVEDHTFLPGEGVCGTIAGSRIHVGNERLFRRLGMYSHLPMETQTIVKNWENQGGTIGFISIGDTGIAGMYCVADAVRPEAKQVLQELKSMGIKLKMLTGDHKDTAYAIGTSVGLDESDIQSELLPEEKLQYIRQTQQYHQEQIGNDIVASLVSTPRLLLMCGDGVNDAPGLAASDVGVAMGEGAALAMETADITLMDSNLLKLLYSMKMGQRVLHKLKENILFSVGVKLIMLFLALVGKASLWAAIGSDVGAMLIVTMNGMSLLPTTADKKPATAIATTTVPTEP